MPLFGAALRQYRYLALHYVNTVYWRCLTSMPVIGDALRQYRQVALHNANTVNSRFNTPTPLFGAALRQQHRYLALHYANQYRYLALRYSSTTRTERRKQEVDLKGQSVESRK